MNENIPIITEEEKKRINELVKDSERFFLNHRVNNSDGNENEVKNTDMKS